MASHYVEDAMKKHSKKLIRNIMADVKTYQGKDAWDIIVRAVNKTVSLISPTFGPASNKVIISKQMYGNSKPVLDDGVQIARDLELEDPSENAILNVIRETA